MMSLDQFDINILLQLSATIEEDFCSVFHSVDYLATRLMPEQPVETSRTTLFGRLIKLWKLKLVDKRLCQGELHFKISDKGLRLLKNYRLRF
jgi:hypothetical protein